jgi:site-specific recombinase XerD
MVEDMEVRGFTACTQRGYIAAVRNFTAFLGRPPDQADKEDLRRFQHHMRSEGASAANMNLAVSALRFFFRVSLERGDAEVGMTTVRPPQRLPVILSPEEVARLLDAAPGLKARAALSPAYGAGLRASEVVSLKVSDIDSGRRVIRVEQGPMGLGGPQGPLCHAVGRSLGAPARLVAGGPREGRDAGPWIWRGGGSFPVRTRSTT